MKTQLYIKSVDSSFFNRPQLGYFIETVFKNFHNLYDFPQLNHNRNEIIRLLNSQTFHGFIVFYGKYIIGYLLGEVLEYKNMYLYFINYLYISPVFQNKKLGSQLLNLAKEYSISQNTQGIGLITDTENDKNLHFYRKHGFQLCEERLYQRHELYVWMR